MLTLEERQRKVADAIILERAERVLSRYRPRRDETLAYVMQNHITAEAHLRRVATRLREEGENGA
jgi:hypothetical protein